MPPMLAAMNSWDVALLAIAGYVAVMSLARLMLRRRDQLLAHFREEIKREKERKAREERRRRAEEELRRQDVA